MKESDRIVGGQAAPASIPWQVSMDGGCGGTILDSCTVISAAHCLYEYGAHISVGHEMRMGSTSKSSGGQVRRVAEIILNQEFLYGHVEAGYDFVIFKLDSPLEFNEDVQPACLPTSDFFPEYDSTIGDRCFTSGWGHHYFGEGILHEDLSYVRVPIISNEECREMSGGAIHDSELCAGYAEGGKDSCQNDSGGPLVCNVNGKAVATGVVSRGYKCAKPNHPGIYGRITKVLDWIKSNMGSCGSVTTTSKPTLPSSGCETPEWQGDNYCDDGNNNAECAFDGGDCCGNNVNTTYCTLCQCLDPTDPTFSTTKKPPATCLDLAKEQDCEYWAETGICNIELFQGWMELNCKKSCGFC